MKVYVAGKTQDKARVKAVQNIVRVSGHEVTHDWTAIIDQEGGDVNEVDIEPDTRTKYALWDLDGVKSADVLIAIGHPGLSGTLWECGMAAMRSIPVWLVNWDEYGRVSIFEDLPNVERISVQEVGERLWEISVHHPLRTAIPPFDWEYLGLWVDR